MGRKMKTREERTVDGVMNKKGEESGGRGDERVREKKEEGEKKRGTEE